MSDKMIESIAKKLGKEGVEYFEKNAELPPIKLSEEEMKYIKGGTDINELIRRAKKVLEDWFK